MDINNLSPASDVRILISVSAKNSSPRYRTSRGRASPHSPSGAWWRNTAGMRAGRPRLSRSMSKCRPANIDTISTDYTIEVFPPSGLRLVSSEVCRWTWICPLRWARSRRRRSTWRLLGTAPSADTPPSGEKHFSVSIFFSLLVCPY